MSGHLQCPDRETARTALCDSLVSGHSTRGRGGGREGGWVLCEWGPGLPVAGGHKLDRVRWTAWRADAAGGDGRGGDGHGGEGP